MTRARPFESATVSIAIESDANILESFKALAESREPRAESLSLTVVLLPPLVQMRRIELPPMTPDDARRAIARSASRYWMDATMPQTIAARRVSKSAWMVAAAPTALISGIHEATRQFGWHVDAIVPAQAAWASAVGTGRVAFVGGNETTVIQALNGVAVEVRRARAGVALPAELADARFVAPVPDESRGLAIQNGARASAFELAPDDVHAFRARVARRLTWQLGAAAAALLVFAAGVTLWGEHRELNAIREQRRALHAQVLDALSRRDSLVETSDRLTAIADAEQSSERWSAAIARVAEALPGDAYLTAFRAEADSVLLEGQASNAAGVFAAMRQMPGLIAVRAAAPIRQEGGTGQPVSERFTMGARVSVKSLFGDGGSP